MILNHVLNEKKSRTDEARNLGRSPRVGRLVAEVDHCGLRRGTCSATRAPARTTTTQPGGDAALLESEPASMIIAVVFAAAASAAPAAPVAPPSKPCVLHQPPPLRPSRCCSISVSAPLPGAASASSASSAALSGCWLTLTRGAAGTSSCSRSTTCARSSARPSATRRSRHPTSTKTFWERASSSVRPCFHLTSLRTAPNRPPPPHPGRQLLRAGRGVRAIEELDSDGPPPGLLPHQRGAQLLVLVSAPLCSHGSLIPQAHSPAGP